MKKQIMPQVLIIKSKNITKEKAADYTDCHAPFYGFDELSELYKLNSYHQRCINVKANITAGLGYSFVSANDNRINESEMELIAKILEKSGSRNGTNFIDMLIRVQTDYEIFGNGWIEISRNLKGEPDALYHLPGQYVRIMKSDINMAVLEHDGERKYYRRFGSERKKGINEFIQLKNYNPSDNIYGVPEYISALSAMLLDRTALDYNISRINNRTMPEALITITGTELTPAQREEITEFFEGNFGGKENAGKVLLIQNKNKDANIQIQEVKTSLLEGVFSSLRKEIRDEIISIHGVPPRLVGVVTSGQLGGVGEVKEQNRIFREIVIAPRKSRLEYHLNSILAGIGIETIRIRLNSYDISDNLDDAKYVETLLKNKIIDIKEARKMLIG